MTKIRNWYIRHQDAITWWIIGFWSATMIDALARQDWTIVSVGALIVAANAFFYQAKITT